MSTSTALSPGSRLVRIGPLALSGVLTVPRHASGIVLFAHGSGSSRFSPRNVEVANALQEAGLATLQMDLLTPAEAAQRSSVFDIGLLSSRVDQAIAWLEEHPETTDLKIGLFGASTGAAAALAAAARRPEIGAVVSRGGRPDLAGESLHLVQAPTLLIVGGADTEVLALNQEALAMLTCEKEMLVIPDAGHLFEESGALETVAYLSIAWFTRWLTRTQVAAPFSGQFLNRADAGRRLAARLADLKPARPIIFALPRGGVSVAHEVAQALGAPLDLILVRKIGTPDQPELAVGAIVDGQDPELVINEPIMHAEGLTRSVVEALSKPAVTEIERRRKLYFAGRTRPNPKDRVAIVVDDGLATGATMRVAIQALRKRKPKRIILAAPVASPEAIRHLKNVADEVRVLQVPQRFDAVGHYYRNFEQVTDEEVLALLAG